MKLEIELDLNKIDYEAINQQIKHKLEELNIEEHYRIKDSIKNEIKNQVQEIVKNNMCDGYYWSERADTNTRNAITNELKALIIETLQPAINKYFDDLPEEQIDRLIADLMPKIFLSRLKEKCDDIIYQSIRQQDELNLQYLINEIDVIKNRLNI